MFASLREARSTCATLTDFCAIDDITAAQARGLLRLAADLKWQRRSDVLAHSTLLPGRKMAMIFEKPSLRTRVSFEVGMVDMGGHALYLAPSDIGLGTREPARDVARVLSRMVHVIMARVFAHSTVRELAAGASIPVINGLCDREHPCQALADFQTIHEAFGDAAGRTVAYIGDGNNVAHSLLLLGARLGARVIVACPPGYEPHAEVVAAAAQAGVAVGGSVAVTHDPREACAGADVVYTDVWTSMGQEAESQERRRIFAPYQVNAELTALANPEHIVLHCLPAHRGEEITDEVMADRRSRIFDQAENRLHAQKAVIATLLS